MGDISSERVIKEWKKLDEIVNLFAIISRDRLIFLYKQHNGLREIGGEFYVDPEQSINVAEDVADEVDDPVYVQDLMKILKQGRPKPLKHPGTGQDTLTQDDIEAILNNHTAVKLNIEDDNYQGPQTVFAKEKGGTLTTGNYKRISEKDQPRTSLYPKKKEGDLTQDEINVMLREKHEAPTEKKKKDELTQDQIDDLLGQIETDDVQEKKEAEIKPYWKDVIDKKVANAKKKSQDFWDKLDSLAREGTYGKGNFASTARTITLKEAGQDYVKAFTMTQDEYYRLIDLTLEANGFMPKHSSASIFFRTAVNIFTTSGSIYNKDGTISRRRATLSLESFVQGFHEYCQETDAAIMHPEMYNKIYGGNARLRYLSDLDNTVICFIETVNKIT